MPFGKIFEKILASQIVTYFDQNNLFYSGQYGFRSNNSCELALHKIISDINDARNNSIIVMLLFIDFRKAFDLFDSSILLKKLSLYGFCQNSIGILSNYFESRSQKVKFSDAISVCKPCHPRRSSRQLPRTYTIFNIHQWFTANV